MYTLRQPDASQLARLVASQEQTPSFAVTEVIPDPPPAGFQSNRGSGCVGQGAAAFGAAVEAALHWEMFPSDWVRIEPRGQPVSLGQTVVVVARCWGVWTANCCRVTHLERSSRQLAFQYATTAQHALSGAERFCVEWRHDDSVWFTIHAISRPRDLAVWLALPKLRQLQRRFAREAPAALSCAVERRLAGKEL